MKHIYYNGNIITMKGVDTAQAFVVENGHFTQVGSKEQCLKEREGAELTDLQGQTVLPAFIDAHSHLSSYANSFLQAKLTEAASFADILNTLKMFAEKTKVQAGGWITGSGYDHNNLKEKAHPTRQMLDEAFPGMAVVLQHKSGHFGVFSTVALQSIGMTGKDQDGYLEENEFVEAQKKVPMPEASQMLSAYRKALDSYASYGITTVQEGMMVSQMLPLYQMLLQNQLLTLDVVGYPQIADADIFYQTFLQNAVQYQSHFRLGGYKIILDGSPQGRTAWMKTPYQGTTDYFGVSSMSDEAVEAALVKAVADKRQLLAHCNGDAAAEQFLNAAQKVAAPEVLSQIRPVIVHGQLLAKDQLERVKEYGMIPSFFVAHCYYWGDIHIENFGMERASAISPTKSALQKDILFTFHQDTPVLEPDMLQTVWCAVNRRTKNGITLGKEEQISVREALKAVTIHAAYQYGEESAKGSIEPGKNADFIILTEDPLHTASDRLNQIKVQETYRSGERIFARGE